MATSVFVLAWLAVASAVVCDNGYDSSTDRDAASGTDVCSSAGPGIAKQTWTCDLANTGGSNDGTINMEVDANGMNAYGQAANGNQYCCAQPLEVTIKIVVYGTDLGDTLEIHDGGVTPAFQCSHPGTGTCAVEVHGRAGADTIESSTSHSMDVTTTLYGDQGNDRLECQADAAPEDDSMCRLHGNGGDDTLVGSDSEDTLSGGPGDDSICGFAGPDTILGGADDDDLCGGNDDDTINGNAGEDAVCGEAGDDAMNGGTDDDQLHGGTWGGDSADGGAPSDYDTCSAEAETNCDADQSTCPVSDCTCS